MNLTTITATMARRELTMMLQHRSGSPMMEIYDALEVVDAWDAASDKRFMCFRWDGKESTLEVTDERGKMRIDDFAEECLRPIVEAFVPYDMETGLWAQFAEAA